MKKFLSYLKGWRGFALISYMWLVLMAWVVLYVDISSPEIKRRFYAVSTCEIILFALCFACPRLLEWAENLHLLHDPGFYSINQKRKYFFQIWAITFLIFSAMYIVFYPGGFGDDNIGQYSQAIGISKYNDWHPVLQTLLAYTLPLKITGGAFCSIYIFQILLFSLVLAYTALVVREYSNRKHAKYSLIYILLNPLTLTMAITPLKDTTYSIAGLLLMNFTARIYFTKGQWLKNTKHTALFVIVITATTIFRHNAILFTLPLLLAVMLYTSKKRAVVMLLCFIALFWGVKYPFYNYLDVARPGNRQIETLGLAMTVIGNTVKESPEKLDAEILEFAHKIAPQETWEKYFKVTNGLDSMKLAKDENNENSDPLFNLEVIEQTGWKKVLIFTLRCFRQSPFYALRGALETTNIVYGLAGAPNGMISPVISKNNFGISPNQFFKLNFLNNILGKISPSSIRSVLKFTDGNTFNLQALIIIVNYIITLLFKHLFWHVGVINLVIIILVLGHLRFDQLEDCKRFLLVLPVLLHNYGTMLLLASPISRYFYYSFLLMPLIIVILLQKNSD